MVEIERHWERVAALGCLVTRSTKDVTLHHCHGGSLKGWRIHKGFGQKTSDWLVIPIVARLHSLPPLGIDAGGVTVREWEEHFGRQFDHLVTVSCRLGYNCFKKAGYDHIRIEGLD